MLSTLFSLELWREYWIGEIENSNKGGTIRGNKNIFITLGQSRNDYHYQFYCCKNYVGVGRVDITPHRILESVLLLSCSSPTGSTRRKIAFLVRCHNDKQNFAIFSSHFPSSLTFMSLFEISADPSSDERTLITGTIKFSLSIKLLYYYIIREDASSIIANIIVHRQQDGFI